MGKEEYFEVGEMAIIQHAYNQALNGEEVEVIMPLGTYTVFNINTRMPETATVYIVRTRTGEDFAPEPYQLRKIPKRGDMDKVVSWDDCGWKPRELVYD